MDKLRCYQCDSECNYLFYDGRCKDCTRYTPEEVMGNVAIEEEEEEEYTNE